MRRREVDRLRGFRGPQRARLWRGVFPDLPNSTSAGFLKRDRERTNRLHGKGCGIHIERDLKADLIRQARAIDEIAVFDFRDPVRAPTRIPYGDAGFSGKCRFGGENGWDGDGSAVGNQSCALCGGDPDAGTAITSRATTDEDGIKMPRAVFLDDFRQRPEQQSIVAAIAGETFFDHDLPVNRQRKRRGISGSLENQDGRHGRRLTRNLV